MDVRIPPALGLVCLDIVIDSVRALEGVPVLGVEVLDGAADSCFVGDFVGDFHKISIDNALHFSIGLTRSMLDDRDPLVAGLGLPALILIRLPPLGSCTALILRPSPELTTLLGLAGFLMGACADFVPAAGCSMIVTTDGLRNIPLPISHSKYLSP
jgi:hypothetical protein